MPDKDPSPLPRRPPSGPLARLERDRDALAKAWLVRLIERASLEEISELPTARLAGEVPELISDVLSVAATMPGRRGAGPAELDAGGRERAERLLELRDAGPKGAVELARDVGAIELVILEALKAQAAQLDPEEVVDLAAGVAAAAGAVQGALVEALMDRRARELETAVDSDPLTGLLNLRSLRRELGRALALNERYDRPFALLVLDVEGLRRINDAQGTQAGDRVLVQVALAVCRTIRSVDVPARIGGDELCVLAPDADLAAAQTLGARLAEGVSTETATADGPGVGVAIGVVGCPEHGKDPTALMEAADGAMFQARAAGRAVAVAGAAEPEITVKRTR